MTIIGIRNATRELYKIQRIENDENKWKQLIVLAEKLPAPVPVGLNTREKINAIIQNIHIVLQTEMMSQKGKLSPDTKLRLEIERLAKKLRLEADLASTKQTEAKQKNERSVFMLTDKSSQDNWDAIKNEYDISKKEFGKKINFVKDKFKRKVIFRDVEDAFVLAWGRFPKAAIILAGGVIEELLRLYLEHKNVQAERDDFFHYIKACQEKKPPLLKSGISKLSDSVREWRNLVHLSIEEPKRHTISKATAKGAVSSIFIIANDFQ